MKARKGSENHDAPAARDQHDTSEYTTRELPSLAEASALDTPQKADNRDRADYTTKKLPVISNDQEPFDPRAVAEQTGVPGDAQAGDDVDSATIARLRRRAEAAELDHAALEERIRMLQRRGGSSRAATVATAGSSGRRGPTYWLRELAIALVLGLALLLIIDYWVAGDTIPLLPEARVEHVERQKWREGRRVDMPLATLSCYRGLSAEC